MPADTAANEINQTSYCGLKDVESYLLDYRKCCIGQSLNKHLSFLNMHLEMGRRVPHTLSLQYPKKPPECSR